MPANYFTLQKSGKEFGFNMIEILVSIVIVSIGLLGLAALQAVQS